MLDLKLDKTVLNIFTKNRKCIVNTDLDGILSGMLLQKFLNWEIVGYSYCNGSSKDELWLKNKDEKINECVFVDLPVFVEDITVIDQHFIALDDDICNIYKKNNNKLNPNILKSLVFNGINYKKKYPFGTVHFILAILENLNLIDETIDFDKHLGDFDVLDLFLRADCVIGNTVKFTDNCLNWAQWLLDIGNNNTQKLFEIVIKDYYELQSREKMVESKLKSLGCASEDGECSNMFREKNYNSIKNYFQYLSDALEMKSLPVFDFKSLGNLKGEKNTINYNSNSIKTLILSPCVFSFAFVSMKVFSITYQKNDEGNFCEF